MRPEREPDRLSPAERALHALQSGDEVGLAWLRQRVQWQAARRFAPWAWEMIREDFLADLQLSLARTLRRRPLEFRSGAEFYIDRCIANLCRRYFRVVGRLRAQEEFEPDRLDLPAARSSTLDRVAAALDLHAVLAELPEPCRKRLLAKYLHGQSMQQLAAREGVHEKTMRSRLHECRRRFREIHQRLQHSARRRLLGEGTEG